MVKKRILLIEDDSVLQDIFAFALGREGYQIIRASDGLMGLQLAQSQAPDMVLVDAARTQPGTADTCRGLREEGVWSPILAMLRRSEDNLLAALDASIIKKPFQMQDLLLRIRTATWEKDFLEEPVAETVVGRLTFIPAQLKLTKDGQEVKLIAREFDLLYYMSKSPGKVFDREELLREIWGFSYIGSIRLVDVAIRRLREKIEDDPGHPEFVITRRGRGYSFSGI